MSLFSTLAFAMGSAWVSGINLYASVATLGLLGRFAHLQLPGDLSILTGWWVIGVALALYLIEFIADKVPVVDSAWDAIHTFIRVPAGAALAAASFGDYDKSVQLVAFLLGGGLALSSHGTKAATRLVVNTSPEPGTNVAASLAEDGLAVGKGTAGRVLSGPALHRGCGRSHRFAFSASPSSPLFQIPAGKAARDAGNFLSFVPETLPCWNVPQFNGVSP